MPSNSSDFNQILNIAPSGYMKTIKDSSLSQEHQYNYQLQQELFKCHRSLREFLMPLNSIDFNQILNIAPSGHVQIIQNIIKDTSPSQEHQSHHQLQQKLQKCHQSSREFLMPSNSSDFNQIFKIAPSGYLKTIENIAKDTSPTQEHPNHHQLQPKLYKCHRSLREFLMPSNSSDFNQISNIAPSQYMKTIDNVIKDTSPSQEHQYHYQLQQEL